MKIKVGYCSELDHTGSHYTRFTVLTTILPTKCLCIVCTEYLVDIAVRKDRDLLRLQQRRGEIIQII